MHYDGTRERKGGSGRIGEKVASEHKIYPRVNVTLPYELCERLDKFCYDEERARSWAIQKAVEQWLAGKGY